MGWEVGGRFKSEGTSVYLWLIHDDVWPKPTQYCKVIILQLKINYKNKQTNKKNKKNKLRKNFFKKKDAWAAHHLSGLRRVWKSGKGLEGSEGSGKLEGSFQFSWK